MQPEFRLPLVLLLLLFCIGCFNDSDRHPYQPTYVADTSKTNQIVFGVPNLAHYELYEPLVKAVNKRLKGVQIKMVGGSTFGEYLDKLERREFDFTIFSGASALEQEANGYTIVAKMSGDDLYRGVIIVNKDSGIHKLADLKGTTISSARTEALAGYRMPAWMLDQAGIDIIKDLRFLWINSFESIILNVYRGKTAAGFCWLATAKNYMNQHPELEAKVELKWITPPLPNLAVMFRKELDPSVAKQLLEVLLSIDADADGRKTLHAYGAERFEPANTASYKLVAEFMRKYGKIPQPKVQDPS